MRLTGPTDETTAREGAAELAQVEVNVGFARAVIEGVVTGQLHTSESHAGAYHAVHPYGMSLIWGEGVGAAFDEIVAHLQAGRYRDRDEWLQIDPRWAGLPWERELTASPLRASVHERVNFGLDPAAFDSAHGQAPEGWAIVPADSTDFAQPGAVVPREFWNDADQFLEHGGGWRAEHAGKRGALAFTSFRFDDELEIGIETHPDARGKGLATVVAARMIDDLLQRGITPVWSCRASNHASVALATKLGFTPAKRLPYYGLTARQRRVVS